MAPRRAGGRRRPRIDRQRPGARLRLRIRRIGGRIVEAIEALARTEGLTQLVLETGTGLDAAWRVYERAGFTRCGPVLHYPDIPSSAFYQKALVA